jgi:hypothetical protein
MTLTGHAVHINVPALNSLQEIFYWAASHSGDALTSLKRLDSKIGRGTGCPTRRFNDSQSHQENDLDEATTAPLSSYWQHHKITQKKEGKYCVRLFIFMS